MTASTFAVHLFTHRMRKQQEALSVTKQSRKTPSIPWHNGYDKCLSCGKDVR